MALPVLHPLRHRLVSAYMADVSAASSAFAISPFRGRVVKVGSVLYSAITGADSAMTTKIAGTAITGGAWTVTQSGSAAGDIGSATPTAKSTTYVNEGQNIEFITDGVSSTTAPMTCWAVIEVT